MRVRTRLLIPLAALALAFALGCESENFAACEGFVRYYQQLPCTGGALPDVDCNAFSDYPCPIDDHFQCLEQGHTCNEANELRVDLSRANPDGTTTTCAALLDCEG